MCFLRCSRQPDTDCGRAMCIHTVICHQLSLLTFLPATVAGGERKPRADVFAVLCYLSKFCQHGKGSESSEKTSYFVRWFQELYSTSDRSILLNSFNDSKVCFHIFLQVAVYSAFFHTCT